MMSVSEQPQESPVRRRTTLLILVWLWVGLPFAYGLADLVREIIPLLTA